MKKIWIIPFVLIMTGIIYFGWHNKEKNTYTINGVIIPNIGAISFDSTHTWNQTMDDMKRTNLVIGGLTEKIYDMYQYKIDSLIYENKLLWHGINILKGRIDTLKETVEICDQIIKVNQLINALPKNANELQKNLHYNAR